MDLDLLIQAKRERWLELQALLTAIPDVTEAYFQQPNNVDMRYPCIVFAADVVATQHASNRPYFRQQRYLVTIMDTRPNTPIEQYVAEMPTAKFNRRFTADKLHHVVYTLFF
jgi:hypothetical protein